MVNPKKRILVLTSTFPRWKDDCEPSFVFELCRRLSDHFEILVLAPHAFEANAFEKLDGINIIRFRYYFPRWEKLAYEGGILANLKRNPACYLLLPLFFFSQFFALLGILRHQNIEAIHAHWLIPQGLTTTLVSIFVKKMPPVICTSHGGDLLGLNGPFLTLIKRWIMNRSAMIVVVSNAMRSTALSMGTKPEKVKVISMGVDTNRLFTPNSQVPRSDHQLLFVGRLVEKKGVAYLLDALPKILSNFPKTRLNIIGTGPEESILKKQARRLGIDYAVNFSGAAKNSEIPASLRRATVFVAPSIITAQGDQEGLGLVFVEALACECPVVATNLPAIRDTIIDGITGLICQQKDSTDLAEKVCYLLNDIEYREALGRKGRQHVQLHFDWQIIALRYHNLIDNIGKA